MKAVLISLLFLSTSVLAKPEMQKISKGQCAPYDGYVINYEMETEFRKINEERKLAQSLNISLKDLQVETEKTVDILKRRLDNSNELNDRLYQRISNQEKQDTLINTLFFIGGAALAGGVAIGLSKGLRK